MTATQEQFSSLKEDVRTIGDTVLDVRRIVDGHNHRFDQVDARFDQVDARFDQMDARFARVDARLDKVDEHIDKMDGRLDGLQDSVSEILTLVRKSQ